MSRRSTVPILCAALGCATPAPAAPYGRLVALAPASVEGAMLYRLIAAQEAAQAGVPYALVDAVMKIESDYRPDRIGDVGEIGLMQVRPSTAALLGFRGDAHGLADLATNIYYGTAYLARAWHLTGGRVCRTLMKYRAGHGEETMSDLSATYCARARAYLLAGRSPLAETIHPADLLPDVGATPSAGGRASTGHGFWSRFEARIRRIDERIEARWRRVATR